LKRSKREKVLEIVASVVGVLALLITAVGYPQVGFVVALFASTLYAVYGYLTRQFGIMVSSLIYGAVEVVGIIRWVFLAKGHGA
jgi:nicotinamide mononucleotide transporter